MKLSSPSADTTHVSTYDADGNAVALTHAVGICSGVIVPNTGIALNSGMDLFDPIPGGPSLIRPGKARVSGMAPTIVFDVWRPAIVSCAPGTNAIVTSVVQVIAGLVDGKLSPVEAVQAPRVHCGGGPVFVEGRVSRAGREALADAGFDLRLMPANYAPGMARNQAIRIDARGQLGRRVRSEARWRRGCTWHQLVDAPAPAAIHSRSAV